MISDRTQAPSGAGYALENRLVSARTLPAMLDQCRVRPLHATSSTSTIKALLGLAPQRPANPRVVVLTPGPNSETYFEHSFFARQWDFPLVGGADLTVRDSRVYLKTLAGLNPVDVILRRLDDDFCDPLELRGDSLLGVPGLVQAARAGTVVHRQLPRQRPGGDAGADGVPSRPVPPRARRRAADAVGGHVVVRPGRAAAAGARASRDAGDQAGVPALRPARGVPGDDDRRASGARWRARIEAHPTRFVAQEQVDLSTAPVHTHRGLEPRHVVLRVLAAWDGTSYAVLPGRADARGHRPAVAGRVDAARRRQQGHLGDRRRRRARADELEPSPQRRLHVTSTELSSRMADNLFWLGRYAERLEANARLFRVLLPALSGESDRAAHASVDTVLHFLRGLDLLPPESRHATVARQWWTPAAPGRPTWCSTRRTRPASAGTCGSVRRLSWEVKERLSPDTWRVLQQLDAACSRTPPTNHDRRVLAALAELDDVVIMLSAFAGLLAENPTRGYGWRFLAIGRRMERALQMLELLRVGVAIAPFPDDAYLEVLLQVADSSTTYRSRYLASIRTRYVLELLLADETNPRSVAFQAAALLDGMHSLPATRPRRRRRRRYAGQAAAASCSATPTWTTQAARCQGQAAGARRRTCRRLQRRHRPVRCDHGALPEPLGAVAADGQSELVDRSMRYRATHTTRYRLRRHRLAVSERGAADAPRAALADAARIANPGHAGAGVGRAAQGLLRQRRDHVHDPREPRPLRHRGHERGGRRPRARAGGADAPWEAVRDELAAHDRPEALEAFEFVLRLAVRRRRDPSWPPTRAPASRRAGALLEGRRTICRTASTPSSRYQPKATRIDTPLLEALEARRGVCQDFSHVMIGALRSLGLAARYVSGYLRSGAEYQGAEASHAWVSVFCPAAAGSISIRPTTSGPAPVTSRWRGAATTATWRR